MASNKTIIPSMWVDYSQLPGTTGLSYGGGGTIAGSALEGLETNLGFQLPMVSCNCVGNWANNGVMTNFSATQLDKLITAGRLCFLAWNPWDQAAPINDYYLNCANIAAGNLDSYITTWMTALAAWGGPIVIRMFIEENLVNQFPWQYGPTGTGTVTYGAVPVTSITASGTSWTVTMPTTHIFAGTYAAGMTVVITGSVYAGTYTVASVSGASSNILTITNATSPGAFTSATLGASWSNTAATFVSAFNHVVTLARAAGCSTDKVKFVWSPNIRATSQNVLTFATMYPSGCDIIGVDGYTYRPDMTLRDVFRGGTGTWGGGTGLADSYAELAALDAFKPMMICETGFYGVWSLSTDAITSITTNGTTWTIVIANAPPGGTGVWAANQGLTISAASPSAYNGQYTIASVSGAGPYTLVVNNTATPAAFVSGSAAFVDRLARAIAVTQSFEIDLPAMPRFVYANLFYTLYGSQQWTMDWNGAVSQATNADFVALKNALGGGHYLTGGNMGSNLTSRNFVPFEDQPMTTVGQERFVAVVKSTANLITACMLNDASGPAVDISGSGRNGTLNGTVSLAAANVIPAEPTWTSANFPGGAGNNISFANNAIWSPPNNNGQLSLELGFLMTATPVAQQFLFAKASFDAGAIFEYGIYVDATHLGVTLWQSSGSSFATWTRTLPTLNVPHHLIVVIDTTTGNKFITFYDGVLAQGTFAAGVMTAGSAVPTLGQRTNSASPFPFTGRITSFVAGSTAWTAETYAAHYGAWRAAPVHSAPTILLPTGNTATVGWTTDVAASSLVEYGPTTAYGSQGVYNPTRATSHSVSLAGLAPSSVMHYRMRSRNTAGTETVGPDQVIALPGSIGGLLTGG